MKFTKGFWLVRDEYTPEYVRDFYAVEECEDSVKAYGPYKKITGRGDTLNTGMMTYTLTAPMEDVLGIRMQNHVGSYVKEPAFLLHGETGRKPVCVRNGQEWTFSSGALSLKLSLGDPGMDFYAEGRRITCVREKTMGMMHHKDGRDYIVAGLNLGVGELVYSQ